MSIITRNELQRKADNNDLSHFIDGKRFKIELEPFAILSKPNIGLIAYNYVTITGQNFSNLEIDGLDYIIFEDCDFTSSIFLGNLHKVIFNRSKIAKADFTNVRSLNASQIYQCNDCLEALYYDDENFRKNLLTNYFTDETEHNKSHSILSDIMGDHSEIASEYLNLIEENNRQINVNLSDSRKISLPTNSSNPGLKFNTQKIER